MTRSTRAEIAEIRDRTFCSRCAAQPIDWHNPDHIEHPERRIGRMCGRVRMQTVLAEIARCTPLCRACHMKEDGRMRELVATARQNSQGQIAPARPCSNCVRLYKPLRRGLCTSCADARYRPNRKRQGREAAAA
jgi:hypothetical protein